LANVPAMTYVLIHGGGSSARFWDRLVPFLDAPVLAVDLPGRNGKDADLATLTVDDEVASVVADIEAADLRDPLVIVAHSSGGLVVPGVLAALGSRVGHVVLNAASVPPEGGSGLDCMQERHRDGVKLAREMADVDGNVLTTPGAPEDPEAFRKTYGGEPLDDETLAYVVDPVRCVTDTINHYFQPVHWSAAPRVPVTYILNLQDRPVPPALQEEMAARLPGSPTIVRIDSGHVPPVTMPAEFADLVRTAVAD
jgi:pimeloyl-ACP methyl ester carboxylesterase